MATAAERYLNEHVAIHCRETSARMYRRLLNKFILPAHGDVPVSEVTRQHVLDLHLKLQHIPYQANRVLEIQSKIFNLAELWGWRGDKGNPCRHVRKYKEEKREPVLSDEEFRRLGEVVNELETIGSVTIYEAAAIRLLMLTGCRKNEIVKLKWKDVDIDAGEIRIPDGKTGARLVPLSPAAAEVPFGAATQGSATLGHSRNPFWTTSRRPSACLGAHPRARRTGRRTDPRFTPLVRLARSGPW